MIQNVYSIYDNAAGVYFTPFVLANDAMAIRTFMTCALAPDHQFNKHPGDFTLFHCGTWDDATATLESWAPQKVMTALEAIHANQRIDDSNGLAPENFPDREPEPTDKQLAADYSDRDPGNDN